LEQFTSNDNDKTKIAFVLGNGRSRLSFDIGKLSKYGTVYGCNRIYDHLFPDYLVAVDKAMIDMLLLDDIQKKTKIVIDKRIYDKHYGNTRSLDHIDPFVHGIIDSGNLACMLAAQHGHTQVFMIGFDYISQDGYHNNVYSGKKPYKDKHQTHTLPISVENWYKKCQIVINRYDKVLFARINNNDYVPPIQALNFVNLLPEDFDKLFPDIYDCDINIPRSYKPIIDKLPKRGGRVMIQAPLTHGMVRWKK